MGPVTDDVSTMRPAPFAEHLRKTGLDRVQRSLDVDPHHAVPVAVGHVRHAHHRVDACVRGEDVDAPEGLHHRRGHCVRARPISHVNGDGDRLMALAAESARHVLGSGGVHVGDGDLRSFRGEHLGDTPADTAGSPRDDRCLTVERLHPRPEGFTVSATSRGTRLRSVSVPHGAMSPARPSASDCAR